MNKNILRGFLFGLAVVALSVGSARATDYTSVSSDDWNKLSNWEDASHNHPSSAAELINGANNFVVKAGTTVTINDSANVNNLTVNGILVFGKTEGENKTVIVNGVFTVNDSVGVADVEGTHVLRVLGGFVNNGKIGLRRSSIKVVNVVFDGTQTISGTGSGTFNNIEIASGTVTNSMNLDIDGSFVIDENAVFNAGSSTLYVAGNFTNKAASDNFVRGTGIVELNGKTVQTISGTIQFNELKINGGGYVVVSNTIYVGNNFLITNNSTLTSSVELRFCGDFTIDEGSTYDVNSGYTCFFRGYNMGAADGDQLITINGNAVFAGISCRSKAGVIGVKTFHGSIYSTAEIRAWGTAKIVDDASSYLHTFSGAIAEAGINLQSPMRLIGGTIRNHDASPDMSGGELSNYSIGTGKITIAGTVSVRYGGTLNILNDLEIESGYIVLTGSYKVSGSDTTEWYQAELKGNGSNTLTVKNGTSLYMRGKNNYPTNFNNVIFEETSTAYYDAEFDQIVHEGDYGSLYLRYYNKWFQGNTNIAYHLYVYPGTNGWVNAQMGRHNHTIGYYIYDDQTLNGETNITSTGTVTMKCSGNRAQYIYKRGAGTYAFKNLHFESSDPTYAQTKYITGDIEVSGTLSLTNNSTNELLNLSLDIDNHEIEGGSESTFILGNNCRIKTSGANNFYNMTESFNHVNLHENSVVQFDATDVEQKIPATTYGNIYLYGNTVKRLDVDNPHIVINGWIDDNGYTPVFTVDNSNALIEMKGDWLLETAKVNINTGATITFNGSGEQEIVQTTLPNVVMEGSLTKTLKSTLTIMGNLTLHAGCEVNADNRTIYLYGNYVNTDGGGGTFHQLAGSLYLRGTGNTQTIDVYNVNNNQFNNIYIEKNQNDTCRFLTDVKIGGNLMTANKKGHIDIQNHTITIGGDLYMYQTCNLLHDGDEALLHLSSSTTEQRISNYNPSIIYPTIRFSGSAVKRLLENSFDIDGDVIIDNDAIVTSGKNMYVSGDWKNSGTFNHSAEMWFDGDNQEISGSAFYHVVFSGTGTKTLAGNINVAGWLKIDSLSTLDVGPDSYGITLNSYWYNNIWNDKHDKTGTFVPREGTVTFVGNNSWEYTGDSLDVNGVGRPGKSFYNVTVSLSDATNYTGLYPIYKTSNKVKSEQNDMYVQNNLIINNGIFYLYWNKLFVGGDLKNLGGTFSMNAHHSQYAKLYLGGTSTHKFDPGKAYTVRQIEVVNGGKYELENDFVMDGSSVDSLLFVNYGEFSLNHHTIKMNSSEGNVIIGERGTMSLDSAAVLEMYSGRHIYNYGHLNLLGDEDFPAKIQPASAGGYYYFVQHSGELAANYYCIEGTRGRGLEIRGGTINNKNCLTNGEFSNSGTKWNDTDRTFYGVTGTEETALLTLNGITLKGGGTLEVRNVTFNSRDGWPKKNVQRTSGSGVIKFIDYGGTMAGPNFEVDGGDLIEWDVIAGFVWTGGGSNNYWRTKGNWQGGIVPGAGDVVILDHTKVTGAYTVRIDSQVVIKNLTIADNVTLEINGNDGFEKYGLIVDGKLNMLSSSTLSQTAKRDSLVLCGSWTNAGNYLHNGQPAVFASASGIHQLTFPSDKKLSAIVLRGPGCLSITGTVCVADSVVLNGGTLMGNNAYLKVEGDWIPRGGIFDIRTSKVYFNGNDSERTQKIYGGRFYGIYFENASPKQLEDNISVYNTFQIEKTSATVKAGVHNIYITGTTTTYWYNKSLNPGIFDQTGNGSVIFNGSSVGIGSTTAGYEATRFNNVLIQGSGSKYFYDIAYIKGSIEVVTGTSIVVTKDGGIDGEDVGALQMNGGGYYIYGEDNFAKNMARIDLSGGTVYYRDSADQKIFATTYSGLYVYNEYRTSGSTKVSTKTLKGNITVTGSITINDSLAILDVDNHTITLTGGIGMATKGHQIHWGENGTLIHVGGSWDVDADITDFCNVYKRGTGYLRANNNWNVTGDMDFLSETHLYMRGFTIDCKAADKSFTMGASSQLHSEVDASLGVAFPTNFAHYNLDEASITYLEGGTNQQLFAGVDYGRLYLNNTAVRTVELTGNTRVRNNMYVNQNDIKLEDNGFDLYLEGATNDLRNYLPTSTLYLDGNQDQQVYAGGSYTNLYINNLKISGSGVKEINENNVYITGDIDVALGSTFSCNDPVMFSGDKITNLGNFYHYGSLFTFTGAKEQTISMDTANQFYGLAVADGDTVTVIGNGIKVGNGLFTLGKNSVLDMGAFTHHIASTQIDKVATSEWITENSNFIFNRANTQYLPAMECKDIQFSTSSTKYLRGDLHAQNITVDAGVGFSVGSSASEAYDVYVSGSWTNNGTFTSQTQTVYFETPVVDNGKTITSNESWFNKVVFNQTDKFASTYKLQDRMLLKDDMTIGANATVHLNGQNLVIGNDDPNSTTNPYRPYGESVNVLEDGHLYVDGGAALLFDHNDDNTHLNVEGKLSLIGSPTANAVVGRYSGSDYIGTEVNINGGATIAANYYQVQYLAPTGFIIDEEATIDADNNLSNGIWSNMYTGNKYTSIIDKTTVIDTFVYLTINVDSWPVTDTIKNLSFIHGGTPLVGTHFNLRRDTTKTDTVRLGGNITGNMGYQNYEWLAYYKGKDKVTEPYTHKIKWPEIKQIVWTGAVNSDWFNPNNWLPRKKPTKELSVLIPLTANSPIIYRNDAECKNLTIANGSLSIEDDVTGQALTVHGSVDVQDGGVLSVENDEEIVVYGDWSIATKGRFVPQHGTVRFMADGGSVSITPRRSDFNNIKFEGGATYMLAGSPINVKGDFIVEGGLVWPAATSYVYNIYGNYNIGEDGNFYQTVTGFVNFAGEDQEIINGKFNRVRFSNKGNKTLSGTFSATYNNSTRTNRTIIVEDEARLTVSSGCALSISGNVLIDADASFNDGGETHTFTGYYWEGLGGHSGSGKVLFSASSHAQYIYGGKFHDLEMTKNTKYINGDVTLTGDLSIYSCTLDMLTNSIIGDNGGTEGTFAMGASSNIYARGIDNYPKFGNYTVTETSKSYYAGPMNQTIRAANYGYLYLNSDTEKTLEGDVNILMDLYFYDNGGTLNANNHNIFLGRNWNNQFSGRFVPGKGGVVFNGSAGTQYVYLGVSVENPFYNITVQKTVGQTFTPSGTNLEIQNSLMVTSGKMSCPAGYTVYIGGDMQVSSDGVVAQSGCYEFNREYGISNIQTNGSILNDVVINGGEDCEFKLNDDFAAYGNFTVQEGIFNQNGYTATLGNSTDNIIICGTYKVGPSGILRIGDASTLVVKDGGRFEAVGDESHYAQVTNNSGRYYFNVESGGTIAAQYYNISYLAKQGLIIFYDAKVDDIDNFSNGIFSNVVSAGVCLDFRSEQEFNGNPGATGGCIYNISFPNNPGGGAVNIKKTECAVGDIYVYNATGMLAGELYENDPNGRIHWLGDVEYVWTAGANNNDWFDKRNWKATRNGELIPNEIPSESTNVVIPSPPEKNTKYPIITRDSAMAKKLTVERGAFLTLNLATSDVDSLGKALVVISDMEISGTFEATTAKDTVSVYGNWAVSSYGKVTAGLGTVEICGVGVKTINNRTYNLNNLIIDNNGTVQIQAGLTVAGNFIIEQGIFDVTTSNYKLTVGGDFKNKGSFMAQTGTLSLNGSGSHTFNPGRSSYNSVSIDGIGAYTLSGNGLYINHNLEINKGVFSVSANFINAGDGSGVDYLNIAGTLDLQANAKLKMGNNATINVNNGGLISMVGSANNEVVVTTQNNAGTYAFNINEDGTILADHYKIERINADGLHLNKGAKIDDTYNMSNGQFVSGTSGGRYLWFENDLETDDASVKISNVSFNTGAKYNAKRDDASTLGKIDFEDSFGVVASYYFEDDGDELSPTDGAIVWSYTATTLYWKGGDENDPTSWHNPKNWTNVGGTGEATPNDGTLVFVPDVSAASNKYPILKEGDGEALGITLFPGSSLTVSGGNNLTVENALSIANGATFIASDGTNLSTISISGQLSNSGNFKHGGKSTVVWTSDNSYDIAMNNCSLYNFTIANADNATITFSMKSGETLKVENDFTIGGGTIDCKGGTLEIKGNFHNEGGVFEHGNGTVMLNGAGDQTITSNAGRLDFYNLELTGSGTKTIGGEISVAKAITIGTTVSAPTADIICYGDWKMPSGSNYRDNFIGGSGKVLFCGTTRQTIGKQETFTNVEFDNSSAIPAFTTSYALTINGSLTLTRGILQSTPQYVRLGSGATLSGGGESAYINGKLVKEGKNDFLFPIGGSDRYAPLMISGLTESGVYSVSYYSVKPSYQDSLPDKVNSISKKEYWELNRISGSQMPVVSLYWMDRNYSELEDLEVASVVLYNENRWKRQIGDPEPENPLDYVTPLPGYEGHPGDTLKGYVTTPAAIATSGMLTFGFTYPTIHWMADARTDDYNVKDGNWRGKRAPDNATNIEVGAANTNHPIVKVTGHCYDMNITDGILEIAQGQTLTVHGNATISNLGTLKLNENSKVIFLRDVDAEFANIDAAAGSELRVSGKTNQMVALSECNNIVFEGGTGSKARYVKTLKSDMQINGSLNIADFTKLATGNHTIGLKGDFGITSNGDFDGTSTILLNGDAKQTIDISPNRWLHNLTVDNSCTKSPQVELGSTTKVANHLTLTNGIINSTTSHRLVMLSGSSTNEGNANSYVTGPMEKQGTDDFVFPTGADTVLGKIGIWGLGNTAVNIVAEYANARPSSVKPRDESLTNVSTIEYWKLYKTTSGSNNPYLTLYWQDSSRSQIGDDELLRVAVYSGGKWNNFGNSNSHTEDDGSGYVKSVNKVDLAVNSSTSSAHKGAVRLYAAPKTAGSSNVTTVSLASVNPEINPLPIELLSFDATTTANNDVKLNWSTASEYQNDFFSIEHTFNGETEMIADVAAKGGAGECADYSYLHINQSVGTHYYRLHQTDFDGVTKVASDWVSVTIEADNQAQVLMSVVPNPGRCQDMKFTVSGIVGNSLRYVVADMSGQTIIDNTIGVAGMSTIQIEATDWNLQPSMYLIKVFTDNGQTVSKFVVE